MKHLLTLLTLTYIGFSNAQNFYEASYVYEGTSFQFVVPNTYEAMPSFDPEFTAYVTDMDAIMEGNITDMLMIGLTMDYDVTNEEDLINNYAEMDLDLLEEVEAVDIKTFTNRNGKNFLLASGKVDDFEEDLSEVHFAMTVFGEVTVIVALVDINDGKELDESLLEALLQSYKEMETDRENEYFPEGPEEDNWDAEEDFGFKNESFQTNLTYDNTGFFPEFDEEDESSTFWDEDWSQPYYELLLAYGYYDLNDEDESAPVCGVKVFSGGYSDLYKTDLQKLIALQEVFPSHYIEGISAKGTLSGDEYEFKTYSVKASDHAFHKQVLYVTHVKSETVFLLGYYSVPPTEELEAEMEALVKTFDYLD
ncbi:MAG: hypothetical protein NXI10_09840 [bacterium]|nr:hypothetical protein [bacterium]